jgi:hypothetical protein
LPLLISKRKIGTLLLASEMPVPISRLPTVGENMFEEPIKGTLQCVVVPAADWGCGCDWVGVTRYNEKVVERRKQRKTRERYKQLGENAWEDYIEITRNNVHWGRAGRWRCGCVWMGVKKMCQYLVELSVFLLYTSLPTQKVDIC